MREAREAMLQPARSVGERTSTHQLLARLGARLLPESVRPRLERSAQLVVLPDGPLADLPFEALSWSPGEVLAERVAGVAYAPSLSVYVNRRRARRESPPRTALVVGNPRFDVAAAAAASPPARAVPAATSAAAGARDRLLLLGAGLPELPATGREARAISAALSDAGFETTLLTGGEATLASVERHAAGQGILHLATHGLAGTAARPYDACLALAPHVVGVVGVEGAEGVEGVEGAELPDFLMLEDLLGDWSGRLAGSELVVLSACDTQRGAQVGNSSLALPWGFFYAGAPCVVASLWKVDDEATSLLMQRFYENLLGRFDAPRGVGQRTYEPGQPMSKGGALLEAKLWLRDAGRGAIRDALRSRGVEAGELAAPDALVPYADPYFWAGFVLLGDGS